MQRVMRAAHAPEAAGAAFTPAATDSRPRSTPPTWLSLARRAQRSPAVLVLLTYAAAACVLPTLANVAVTDDWVYYRAVEILLTQHRVQVPEMASAALVFQELWGGAFAAIFGLSFGVLRVSTLVMSALGGLATYGLGRELNLSRGWSALGMAAVLFSPLAFALSYTFMTDPHFVGLMMISAWLYVRGLRGPTLRTGSVLAGSAVAACSILVREQGVLIPAAVVGVLLLERRLTLSRQGLQLFLRIVAIPVAATLVFFVWLEFVNSVPWALSLFTSDFHTVGAMGVAALVPRLAVVEIAYLGLFVLPLSVAALPATGRLWRQTRPSGRRLLALWVALALLGSLAFATRGLLMPYAGQFIVTAGLGPNDLLEARPPLLNTAGQAVFTAVCVVGALPFGLALVRAIGRFAAGVSSTHRLVLGLAAGQVVGTFPPSVHFAAWDGTLDRYLLPLLPFGVVLMLSALRGVPVSRWLAVLSVAVLAAVSIAGTQDYLSFLDGVWSLGYRANELGVANQHLDAGAGWDGLYLYQAPPGAANPPRTPKPPWWVDLFAPATDSSYVVAGAELPDYAVIAERTYVSWLRHDTPSLYLLRRPDVTGPP